MVAYSFQRQFAQPIIDETKGGTIRATRKPGSQLHAKPRPGGHALPGETLQLYTGMRTKHCRKIADKTCLAVEPIVLNFCTDQVLIGDLVLWTPQQLDIFAVFDGFAGWPAQVEFWRSTHGAVGDKFNGWHIRWLPLPELSP